MMTLTLSRKIPDNTDDVKQMEQKLGNNTKDKHNETQTMIILLCRINQSLFVLTLAENKIYNNENIKAKNRVLRDCLELP